MRDINTLLFDLRFDRLSGEDRKLALAELRSSMSPQNSMAMAALAHFSGEPCDAYWTGRALAWIDDLHRQAYPRLPESNHAVAQVAQRKPYPWEVRR